MSDERDQPEQPEPAESSEDYEGQAIRACDRPGFEGGTYFWEFWNATRGDDLLEL